MPFVSRNFGIVKRCRESRSMRTVADGASGDEESDGEEDEFPQVHENSKSVLENITGGGDPERAVVAYLRFESGSTQDTSAFENHATVVGDIEMKESNSPMEQLRKQVQYMVCCKGDDQAGIHVPISGHESMELGFCQSFRHRNHSVLTIEFWLWSSTVATTHTLVGHGVPGAWDWHMDVRSNGYA